MAVAAAAREVLERLWIEVAPELAITVARSPEWPELAARHQVDCSQVPVGFWTLRRRRPVLDEWRLWCNARGITIPRVVLATGFTLALGGGALWLMGRGVERLGGEFALELGSMRVVV